MHPYACVLDRGEAMSGLHTIKCVLLLCVACSVIPAAHSVIDKRQWQFEVSIDDRLVGTHDFSIEVTEQGEVVESEANFRLKLLFMTVFAYEHKNTEIWRDRCLAEIKSSTVMNRQRFAVNGTMQAGSLVVEDGAGSQTIPGCARSFAYWNQSILDADSLLNPQTGRVEAIQITKLGEERTRVGDRWVPSIRYRIDAEQGAIDVLYAREADIWIGLESTTKRGNRIRYQAVSAPSWNP